MSRATTVPFGMSPRRGRPQGAKRAVGAARLDDDARPLARGRAADGPGVPAESRTAAGRCAAAGGQRDQGQDRVAPALFVVPGCGAEAARGRRDRPPRRRQGAAVPRHAPGHLRRLPRGLLPRHRRPANVLIGLFGPGPGAGHTFGMCGEQGQASGCRPAGRGGCRPAGRPFTARPGRRVRLRHAAQDRRTARRAWRPGARPRLPCPCGIGARPRPREGRPALGAPGGRL